MAYWKRLYFVELFDGTQQTLLRHEDERAGMQCGVEGQTGELAVGFRAFARLGAHSGRANFARTREDHRAPSARAERVVCLRPAALTLGFRVVFGARERVR